MADVTRRQFRSAVVAWRSIVVVVAVCTALTWVAETVVSPPDSWFLHIRSFWVGAYALMVVAVLGLLVAATTPWRRSRLDAERWVVWIEIGALSLWVMGWAVVSSAVLADP